MHDRKRRLANRQRRPLLQSQRSAVLPDNRFASRGGGHAASTSNAPDMHESTVLGSLVAVGLGANAQGRGQMLECLQTALGLSAEPTVAVENILG